MGSQKNKRDSKKQKTVFKGFSLGPLFFGSSGKYIIAQNRSTPKGQKELIARIVESRPKLLEDIRKDAEELENIISNYDPTDIIANFLFMNLFADPETYREDTFKGSQPYVEFLTLVCLKRKYTKRETVEIPGVILENINKLIEGICYNTIYYKLSECIDLNNSSHPQTLKDLQFHSFTNSLLVRGPGYLHHLEDLLKDLFSNGSIQRWLLTNLGFQISDCLTIAEAFASLMDDRIYQRRQTAFSERKKILAKYKKYKETGKIKDKRLLKLFAIFDGTNSKGRDEIIKNTLTARIFFCLGDTFSFSINDIAEKTGIDDMVIKNFLDFFSIEFGEIEHSFFMPQPNYELHYRPIIKHINGFLAPSPALIPWSIKKRIEQCLKHDKKIWGKYEQIRHDYLLGKSIEYLRDALGNSITVYTNLKYPGGELDGLILFDKTSLLLEAKAGELSLRAREGYGERIVKDAGSLVKKAHEQAVKAKKYISSNRLALFTKDRKKIEIDSDKIDSFYIITLSLDNIDIFAQNLPSLKILKLTDKDSIPWIVSLLDLRVISEIIEFPTQFLHYIRKRASINELDIVHAHDELDYLIYYMEEGLDFSEQFDMGIKRFGLLTHTPPLDDYYAHITGRRKTPAQKPTYKMPTLFRDLVLTMERMKEPGYTEPILLLLNISEKTRTEIADIYKKYYQKTANDGQLHDFTVLFDSAKAGITWFICGEVPHPNHSSGLVSYCELKKYQTRSDRWIGLLTFTKIPGIVHETIYKNEPWKQNDDMDNLLEVFPNKPPVRINLA